MSAILNDLFTRPQFSMEPAEKDALLLQELVSLHTLHQERCGAFGTITDLLFKNCPHPTSLTELPYLPVGLFKRLELSSVSDAERFKTLHSSGTSGSTPSLIVLDQETARLQTLALKNIMVSLLGLKRLPMLIIDSESIIQSNGTHSARAAGVIGMMNFGRDHFLALGADEQLRASDVLAWLEKYRESEIFIFGFTAIVWHRFLQALSTPIPRTAKTILIHGGGWKKLLQSSVSNETFKIRARTLLGEVAVHDYYGMVEQVGSIFVECSQGYLHTPNFATVIIRDERTFEERAPHQPGLIQVLSLLPRSYPGHSILTEDVGVLEEYDGCACGWRGRYFRVHGRLASAELRGCSDTARV